MKLPNRKHLNLNKPAEKKPDKMPGSLKASLSTRSFRVGGYSVVATAIILAIAVFANILISALPSGITERDVTSSRIFSLSDQTEQLVESLEEEITIYWIVQSGQEDSSLKKLLDRYEALSDCINVEKKDPDVYPTFAQKYTDTLYNNSLVVEYGDRYRYIDYNDIYVYDYSDYSTDGSYSTGFAGESELTSAIDYVLSDDLPTIYTLTGHGESDLSSSFRSAVEKENIQIEELSLLSENTVPEDADCVVIYAPQTDISEEEKDLLLTYLKQGGDMILITEPLENDVELTNLETVMRYYGMQSVDGIVIEGDQNHYAWGSPYYLLPQINSHDITSPLKENGYYVLLPIAHGLTETEDIRDTVTVDTLLTTSDSAYSKLAGYNLETYDKETGDLDGPFALAMLATETIETDSEDEDTDNETSVLWVSASSLLDDNTNMQVSGGNEDFFLNALHWMCEENDSAISIHTKSLDTEYLTMDNSTATLLTTVVIAIIPILYFATGIYITMRRRKR